MLALVICGALPLSQLAIAGSITVTCCCGPHDIADGCRCADCPGAREDDAARRDSAGGEHRVESCTTKIERGVIPSLLAALPSAAVTIGPELPRPWAFPPHVAIVQSRAIAPPLPDG